ncbi:MAG: C10 family peptidase [Bacteroidales bacterium]|nr:C10 family peptidase [Bacteroidales bacterium]
MKKITLLVCLLAVSFWGFASHVIPVETAMKASKNFLSERIGVSNAKGMDLTLVYTEYTEAGDPVYYRFQVGDKGFMIVSATDQATPVLAFSLESNFKAGTGADLYCTRYKKELTYLMENPSSSNPAKASWDYYTSEDFSIMNRTKGNPCVQPLITTKWNQDTYYNGECPYNPLSSLDNDMRSYVGCVALTMSNILYYYRYPENGFGAIYYIPREYDDETGELIYTYPPQSINFSNSHYNYNNMTDELSSYNGEQAKLLYNCGVATRMGYGHDGSGTQSEYALEALQTYFHYSPNAQFNSIVDVAPTSSLTYLWVELAINELNAHRPLFFSGRNETDGGHAWIVDGYTTITQDTVTDTYFHVNWGWGGYDNGYFLLTNQNTHSGNFNVAETNTMMTRLMPDSADIQKPAVSDTRITASVGSISDGAGNMKYAQNSNRRWVISSPNATAYRFSFAKLKVKPGDKVNIYNGGTEASGIKQSYSGDCLMAACSDYSPVSGSVHADYTGDPLPSALTVNADSVLITFTSTANSETDYGFVLNFAATSYTSTSTSCLNNTQMVTTSTGTITDKSGNAINNDNPYRPSQTCSWQIRPTGANAFVFSFSKFDLKAGDFVDVYDYSSTSAPVLYRHFDINNAASLATDYYFLNASKLYVRFASDNDQEGTGFELNYHTSQTGVEHFDNNMEVSVYPNPANTYVNVSVTADEAQTIYATIVDMAGKTVATDQFSYNGGEQVFQIQTNNLSEGIYFLNLKSQNGQRTQKLIIQ